MTEIHQTDRLLDEAGRYWLDYTLERVLALMKPKMVRYGASEVTTFDALGQPIPELSGEYTDELKAKLDELPDDVEKLDTH